MTVRLSRDGRFLLDGRAHRPSAGAENAHIEEHGFTAHGMMDAFERPR